MGPRLQLLGGFRLTQGEVEIALPTRKAEALLAYLALPGGRPHSRDELAALLWGERGEQQARHSLRQALYVIRQSLGGEATAILGVEGDRIALDPDRLEVDVARFEALARAGSPSTLSGVADLYRGDLLAGHAVDEEPFVEWLTAQRVRLRELAVAALAALVEHHEAADQVGEAIRSAQRVVALDPLREAAHRKLMQLYLQRGREEEALRQYQECALVLRRELAIAPAAETMCLAHEITARRGLPPLAPAPPARIRLLALSPIPRDPDVWWCYQLGLRAMHRFTRRGFAEATRLFRRALRLDPSFAPALADLAYVIWQSGVYGYGERPAEAPALALEAAAAAVACQPEDGEARFVLGMVQRVRREYRAAEEEHERLLELDPTSARGRFGLAATRYAEGRLGEALVLLDEAIRLGPHDPLLWTFLSIKAVTLEALGRHAEAAAWAEVSRRAPHATHLPQVTAVSAQGHLGREEAQRALGLLLTRQPGFTCASAREILAFVKDPEQREHYVDGLRAAGLRR
jgi:DNA-binding SARP family transcriptional activator